MVNDRRRHHSGHITDYVSTPLPNKDSDVSPTGPDIIYKPFFEDATVELHRAISVGPAGAIAGGTLKVEGGLHSPAERKKLVEMKQPNKEKERMGINATIAAKLKKEDDVWYKIIEDHDQKVVDSFKRYGEISRKHNKTHATIRDEQAGKIAIFKKQAMERAKENTAKRAMQGLIPMGNLSDAAMELVEKKREAHAAMKEMKDNYRAIKHMRRGTWPKERDIDVFKNASTDFSLSPHADTLDIWQLCDRGDTIADCKKKMEHAAELQAKTNMKLWPQEEHQREQKQRAAVMAKTGEDPDAPVEKELCSKLHAAQLSGDEPKHARLLDEVTGVVDAAMVVAQLSGKDPGSIRGCSPPKTHTELGGVAADERYDDSAQQTASMAAGNEHVINLDDQIVRNKLDVSKLDHM